MGIRVILAVITAAAALQPAPRFTDNFENGLGRWRIIGENAVRPRPSGDPAHGTVMELVPNGDVAAIIPGSEAWGPVRVEGDMLFPSDIDNYLGFLYNFTERQGRMDFGLIYLKGNDNYLQVNPHRDFNVSRLVYPEGRADLTGAATVGVNTWHRFAFEVDGAAAHVYVNGSREPQLTFAGFEFERGAVGLQPRSVGGAVWIDNVTVTSIAGLSYTGPPVPAVRYEPSGLLTAWQVAGPFERTADELARHPERARWERFATDARGALVTGRIVDFHGPDTVAYLRTIVDAPAAGPAELQFSTADDLAVWSNGEFQAFLARQAAAWFDFPTNTAHAPRRVPLTLRAGRNVIVVRVRGGIYATGGFFAGLVRR